MQNNIQAIHNSIQEVLAQLGLELANDSWLFIAICVGMLLFAAISSYILTRFFLHFKVVRLVGATKVSWDDDLVDHGVFRRIAHVVPGLCLYAGKYALISPEWPIFNLISIIGSLYLIFAFYMVLQAALTSGEAIYTKSVLSQKAPITGFIQVARLILTLALIFLIISLLLDKSPIYLLSGLTAVAAVLLLIFRDTILGFVSGIQIAANRMFNTGDWIEIPKYGVDGDIIEIGLTVVKVQNWDKTISTIPTYALTADAVKNWRGMTTSGGRRIKRSIYIDMRTIGFASPEMLEKWGKLKLLTHYLADKKMQLDEDELQCKSASLDIINSRKLTNIGTFRAYVNAYLKQHSEVNKEMTCMVRQLQASETGLPIEIYCFSKNKNWVEYEHIQSEIFDHLFAILPVFSLSPYQRVSNTVRKSQL
ncbi:mechanosensitive ion channel family protein [Glaciecola sp. 2405UD65-10]|uniref:mechanosensitive ion channel family protein n=1 Tax=Glaciecola sp. 2405UD65-10 TaxID=3397244 RepID=UPI003B5964D7